MSYSFTLSESNSFTETHAKRIASKVATDLKRMQRFYDQPADSSIADYETELVALLKKGYLDTVTYGFKKDDKWIEPTLRYKSKDLAGMESADDDPGKVKPNANVSGASFYSFLTYSSAWDNLTATERQEFKQGLPFQRGSANEPGINGYMTNDKSYSAGGKALDRSSLKSY